MTFPYHICYSLKQVQKLVLSDAPVVHSWPFWKYLQFWHWRLLTFFSCPEQPNGWICHSLSQSLSQDFTNWLSKNIYILTLDLSDIWSEWWGDITWLCFNFFNFFLLQLFFDYFSKFFSIFLKFSFLQLFFNFLKKVKL